MPKALTEGTKAPAFSLPTDNAGEITLKSFAGKKLVLYFYPKDDTSGCTRQAVDFSNDINAFKRAGAVIVGVSKDTLDKHEKFRGKHGLKIMLASDEDGAVLEKYGVWKEKTLYGRKYMGIERTTFLIGGDGVIRQIWRKVKVPGHIEEVLEAVKAM